MNGETGGGHQGNRVVEISGGGAVGTLLIQAAQLIVDAEYRNLALSAVPVVSVFIGYLIHVCYQILSVDWSLMEMNRNFNKAEKRLRKQKAKKSVSADELKEIDKQLTLLQKLRSDAEISRIKKNIETAPESTSS